MEGDRNAERSAARPPAPLGDVVFARGNAGSAAVRGADRLRTCGHGIGPQSVYGGGTACGDVRLLSLACSVARGDCGDSLAVTGMQRCDCASGPGAGRSTPGLLSSACSQAVA